MQTSHAGSLFAGFTSFLWAILPFFLVPLFSALEVVTVIWFRFLFSFLFLFLLFLWKKPAVIRTGWRVKPAVYMAGILLALNYFGFSHGLSLTNPATAQVLIQAGPIIFTFLSLMIFQERLKPLQVVGLFAAVGGFILFYRDQVSFLLEDLEKYNTGVLWVFFGAATWGVYAIFHKSASRHHGAQHISLIIYALGAILFWPFASPSLLLELDLKTWLLLIGVSFNTILAYGALSEAIRRTSAAKVSIIITLNPLLTMVITTVANFFSISWLYADPVHIWGWMGAGLVVAGAVMVVSQRSPTKKFG